MDLYEIFITHNRPWSLQEIGAVAAVLMIAFYVLVYLYKKQKIRRSQIVAVLLLILFLAVVYMSTVFTRTPGVCRAHFDVFWSWREVFGGSREMLKEILLNGILLFPAGLLLPFVRGRRVPWWQALIFGLAVSASIECLQLALCRGMFEWDDMIHNTIGCVLGCLTGDGILDLISDDKEVR